MNTMREEFPEQIKRVLANRVGNRCSRCGALTSGPQADSSKALNVGVASHITAASPGGPRYNPALTPELRIGVENGIWLCQTCAKLIDNDIQLFTIELLQSWKSDAEGKALKAIGQTTGVFVGTSQAWLQRLPDLVVLLIPATVFLALLFTFTGTLGSILIRAYALFLVCYHGYVLGYEYVMFPSLHREKTRPLDTLLVAGIFIALYQFGRNATNISRALISLISFLVLLVVWEIYTMRRGYHRYFMVAVSSQNRAAHWAEYHYWLFLDTMLIVILGSAWLMLDPLVYVIRPAQVLSIGAAVGFTIGTVNIIRYEIIKKRITHHRPYLSRDSDRTA